VHFYILAAAVGLVQGGAQALSRSLFAAMVPRHRAAEFFGFFGASGRLAGVAGPIVFGLTAQVAGSSRFGVASLVVFFVAGGLLLLRVDPEAGAAAARQAERQAGWRSAS
jgi:UMF1 family MFS transporter